MRIHELELTAVAIERNESDRTVRSVIVRVATDSGEEGWGEAPLHWAPEELPGRRDALLTVLQGRSIFDLEELHALPALRRHPLRSGVEIALWDLIGRVCRQPVCHLLGGCFRRRAPVAMRVEDGRPPSASSGRPLSASSDQPDQLARLADEAEQQGFLTIVVPLSGRLADDLATVRAIRAAVGDRLELRLDGAERFDMETARDFCAELEFERIGHLLDPLDTRQLHASAALGRQTSVPLAVARAIATPADALAGVRCGAAALLVLGLDRLGGLLPAHKATTIAEAAGVSVALSAGESVGITSAAMLQLAAARASLQSANECSLPQLADDILADPPELIDGMLTVPQAPGLGVQVDRGKLEQYQIG